jgi:hypothetical protein
VLLAGFGMALCVHVYPARFGVCGEGLVAMRCCCFIGRRVGTDGWWSHDRNGSRGTVVVVCWTGGNCAWCDLCVCSDVSLGSVTSWQRACK